MDNKYKTMKRRLLELVDDPGTTRESKEELIKLAAKVDNDQAMRRHRRAMERLKQRAKRSFDVLTPPQSLSQPPLGQVMKKALDEFFEQAKSTKPV